MERVIEVQLRPSVFDANIAALRTVDGDLAGGLASQPIEPAVVAAGRDGALTFRIPGPEGTSQWFGRTSMPTVSGPALIEQFNRGEGNPALPGVGQGIEAQLLVEQLPAHRAVFVIEFDPWHLSLALRVHEFAGAIQAGRIVLICASGGADTRSPQALGRRLAEFLIAQPGYVIPNRLLSWPWMEPGDVDPFRTVLQSGGERAVCGRAETFGPVEVRLTASDRASAPRDGDDVKVVGLALAPSPGLTPRARALAEAATEVGIDWRDCLADNPARGCALAHLKRVDEHEPALVVAFDHVRKDLPAAFPADLPLVTWLDTPTLVCEALRDRLGDRDRLCPSSSHLARQLTALGVPGERIRVVPLFASGPASDALRVNEAVAQRYRCDVAVFADGADLTPATWGLKLESHERLYRALVDRLTREGHRFHAHLADQVLTQVEGQLKLTLQDDGVRAVMRRQIEQVIGPTLVRLAVVRELTAASLDVRLYGTGWETHESVKSLWHGALADANEMHRALAGSRVVVHADPSGLLSREVFEAAAASRPLLARSHPYDERPGGLATLFEIGTEVLTYSVPREAAALAAHLIGDPDSALQIAAAANARVRADHTAANRLRQIVDFGLTGVRGGVPTDSG